ncbi:exported hypothetical protein [Xenorhabdus szentirmaii DSM 16338]|uniref:Uncharacterized protein n=1 Tax=Xenorhabdus szentirmaii DSM 16338 TaxID=1427518 RepID=W1J6Q3_9GAMM|nr:exported hypothetical protein [Xenorhabdus szentirmaii DSM 16338]
MANRRKTKRAKSPIPIAVYWNSALCIASLLTIFISAYPHLFNKILQVTLSLKEEDIKNTLSPLIRNR